MPIVESPERAARLARAIVSDIVLYNEKKVQEGIEKDTLFDLVKDEIAEGRAHYENQVSPGLLARTHFFERALVDVMLARKGNIKSKIW